MVLYHGLGHRTGIREISSSSSSTTTFIDTTTNNNNKSSSNKKPTTIIETKTRTRTIRISEELYKKILWTFSKIL